METLIPSAVGYGLIILAGIGKVIMKKVSIRKLMILLLVVMLSGVGLVGMS